MEETAQQEQKQKIASAGFSEEFLRSRGLDADSEVTAGELEKLKKEAEEFAAAPKDESANGVKDGESLEKSEESPVAGGEPQQENSDIEVGENNTPAAEEVTLVANDHDPEWVQKYDAIMRDYTADSEEKWERETVDENGEKIEGLKGRIGAAQFYFSAEDKAKVSIEGIDAIANLAAKTEQEIAFNENWSEEFKAKMIEACEKYGVTIQGLENEPQQAQEDVRENPQESIESPESTPQEEHLIQCGIAHTTEFGFKKYAREAAADQEGFAQKIADIEAQGVHVGDNSLDAAHLTMRKYILSKQEGKTDETADLGEALKRYGVASVTFEPEGNSEAQCKVEIKDYRQYTDEEKSQVNAAIEKFRPQSRSENSPELVRQAIGASRPEGR